MAIKHLITTIIIFISIEKIQSCFYFIPGSRVNYDVDENNIDYFPWTVLLGKHLEDKNYEKNRKHEFYHGSLIHPQAVFIGTTTQLQLENSGYSVIGGCKSFKSDLMNFSIESEECQTRKVGDVIVGKYHNNDSNGISDSGRKFEYVNIVILNQPFDLNDRIKLIKLARSNDMVDMNNCFISSLKHLQSSTNYGRVTLIGSYKVDKLTNGSMTLHISENRRLVDNKNREEQLLYVLPGKMLLKIFGSPVVCQDRFDTERYLQIGYLGVRVNKMKASVARPLITYVRFLDIIPVQKEIQKKLNSYFYPNDK
ncbi:uncharacterized protein LOC130667924 [Microplitis mediator]|uniref:uncharacterized protein LOC130667924 n=1 Tax=Microplitis mediator TaxID=375433 RepID=UPI002556B058|nr:uncharacterized protein LOC130667924 [Microplitis mediator]